MGRTMIKSYAKNLLSLSKKQQEVNTPNQIFYEKWGVSDKNQQMSALNLGVKIYSPSI